MELQVREARLTEIDRITALLAPDPERALDGAHAGDVGDLLRQLVYLPNATILVATDGRQVVGTAALALRPSVRHGGLVGTIDLLATGPGVEHDGIAAALVTELLRSARNKGCALVEVAAPDGIVERRLLEGHEFVDGHPTLARVMTRAGALAR